jgi:hypothetical protein
VLELIGQERREQRHEDGEVVQEAGLRDCPASAPRARIRFSTPAGLVPSSTIRTGEELVARPPLVQRRPQTPAAVLSSNGSSKIRMQGATASARSIES